MALFVQSVIEIRNSLQLVELKLPQDGFEIDSLTVSCRNCTWGVTFNATKDGSLKAVSPEHLRCPKTVTAPLGATTAEQSQENEQQINVDSLQMFVKPPSNSPPPARRRICSEFTERCVFQVQSLHMSMSEEV